MLIVRNKNNVYTYLYCIPINHLTSEVNINCNILFFDFFVLRKYFSVGFISFTCHTVNSQTEKNKKQRRKIYTKENTMCRMSKELSEEMAGHL